MNKLLYLLFFIVPMSCFGQYSSSACGSTTCAAELNSKPAIQYSASANASGNCTAGKDFWINQVGPSLQWCVATNTWSSPTGPVKSISTGGGLGSNVDFTDTAEKINLYPLAVPFVATISKVLVHVGTADAGGGNVYDIGLYGPNCAAGGSCPLVAHTGGTAYASTGATNTALSTTVTVAPGLYYVAVTGNNTAAQYASYGYIDIPLSNANGTATSATAGVLPSTVTLSSAGANGTQYPAPVLLFN